MGIMANPAFNGPGRVLSSGKVRTGVRLNNRILAAQPARIMTGRTQIIKESIVRRRRQGYPGRSIRRAVMTRGAGHRHCRRVLSVMRRIDRESILQGTEHAEQHDKD